MLVCVLCAHQPLCAQRAKPITALPPKMPQPKATPYPPRQPLAAIIEQQPSKTDAEAKTRLKPVPDVYSLSELQRMEITSLDEENAKARAASIHHHNTATSTPPIKAQPPLPAAAAVITHTPSKRPVTTTPSNCKAPKALAPTAAVHIPAKPVAAAAAAVIVPPNKQSMPDTKQLVCLHMYLVRCLFGAQTDNDVVSGVGVDCGWFAERAEPEGQRSRLVCACVCVRFGFVLTQPLVLYCTVAGDGCCG